MLREGWKPEGPKPLTGSVHDSPARRARHLVSSLGHCDKRRRIDFPMLRIAALSKIKI